MKMKNEWKWMIGSAVVSFLIVGCATGFEFTELEFARNEVMKSLNAILYLTGFVYTIKNLYLLSELLTAKDKVLALLISIINPIVALLVVVLLYFSFQRLESLDVLSPSIAASGRLIVVFILTALLVFQAIIEVKALMRLRAFIHYRNYS